MTDDHDWRRLKDSGKNGVTRDRCTKCPTFRNITKKPTGSSPQFVVEYRRGCRGTWSHGPKACRP